MAFLPTFEHDIFISYAHVDDEADREDEPGWVTLFHRYLERRLGQRFGRGDAVTVWRDTRRMGGTTVFDSAIEKAIEGSAIFLALNSQGYISKESYCGKELALFHRKVQDDPFGPTVNDQSRIFNLLIQDIPHGEWPDEMKGTKGLPFHEAETEDGEEGMAWPSRPGSERFEGQLRRLVNELYLILHALKNEAAVEERKLQQRLEMKSLYADFTVFLAHTEGTLGLTGRRIGEELRQSGIKIISRIPPPHDAERHRQKVIEEVGRADLAVHLLDEAPGMEIIDAPGRFYYQEQVELARGHAKSQIICVTKMPDAPEPDPREDEFFREHRGFIERLGSEARGERPYTFIRDTPGSFPREILAQIDKIVAARQAAPAAAPAAGPAGPAGPAALLDAQLKDLHYVHELSDILEKRAIDVNLVSIKRKPKVGLNLFEESLKTVSVLIVVFGQATLDWVHERLNTALQVVTSEKECPLRLCCVYTPPDEQGGARVFTAEGIPPQMPVFRIERPEFLGSLLDSCLGFAPPAGDKQ